MSRPLLSKVGRSEPKANSRSSSQNILIHNIFTSRLKKLHGSYMN